MGIFSSSPRLDSLEALLTDQLQDLYDAEQRITKALPKMESAASDADLKAAFRAHLRETEGQVARLERAFQALGQQPKSKTCEAMKGLAAEGDEVVGASGDPDVKDAALIASAQRVEHYEIAAYGCARTFARRLGKHEVASLLEQTLQEEKATDEKLTRLAERDINVKAQKA